MIEILKKQWFVVLIAIILISFAVFSIWDTNKGKLAGKSVDGKDVIASLAEENIFVDDIFETIKESSSVEYMVQKFQDAVAQEAVEADSAMKDEAKEMAQAIETNFKNNDPTNYKTNIKSQLASIGYDDLDEYCMLAVKSQKLVSNYLDEHMDELFTPIYEEKNPRIVSHILIKMEDSANPTEEELAKIQKVEEALAQGTSFADVAKEYSDDSSAVNGGLIGYADADSNLVEAFKETALDLEKDGISDWVKVSSSNYQGWHKIMVLETDKDAIINYQDDNNIGKDSLYAALLQSDTKLQSKIVWEKAQELGTTFASDEIKQQIMDYLGIEEE